MKTVFALAALTTLLSGCGPLLIGSFGGSIAIDQCVNRQNEVCDQINEGLQGE